MKSTNYIIGGIKGFSLDVYMRAMKARYGELESFLRDNQVHLNCDPNKELIIEEWDNVDPITVEDAFKEQNQEKRRVLFSCIGPANLFKAIKPELVDRSVLKLKNKVWNEKGEEDIKEIEDVYELYQIRSDELFKDSQAPNSWWVNSNVYIRVVRCWCTTTGREYWIFIDDRAAQGLMYSVHNPITGNFEYVEPMKNAIEAIAWTFRIGVRKEDIESIYRQGDCLIIKAKDGTNPLPQNKWYHLDEATYREKLVAQS